MLSEVYLAGLIDGEGHIGFNVNRQGNLSYLRVCLEINMTYQPLIETLHEQLGGHYSNHVDTKINRKAQYRWRVVNRQAISVIKLVHPHLIVKKAQADLALAFDLIGYSNDNQINNTFKELMHKLNKKGTGDMKDFIKMET